jgi:hypothetical protein
MISSEECFKHAARSAYMALFSRDPEAKSTWRGMADRWIERAKTHRQDAPKESSTAERLRRNRALLLDDSTRSAA